MIGGAFLVGAAIAVALWPPAPVPPDPPPPPPAKAPAEEARERLDAGDLAGAEKAAQRDPQSADARASLAIVRIRQGRTAEAKALLDEAEKLDPGLDRIAIGRGHVAMEAGDFLRALRFYDEALARRESEEARAARAEALFHNGEYAGAIEEATRAGALFTRAAAYAALGKDEAALRDYADYTAAHPDDAQGWVNRGNVEMRLGIAARAAQSWERAIAADPSLRERLEPLIRRARGSP